MTTKANRGQSPNSQSGSDPDFVRTALRISGGVIVWALHFAAICGITNDRFCYTMFRIALD